MGRRSRYSRTARSGARLRDREVVDDDAGAIGAEQYAAAVGEAAVLALGVSERFAGTIQAYGRFVFPSEGFHRIGLVL